MSFQWLKFNKLTIDELYAILTLRAQVFILEQQCLYLDPDGRDPFAVHLLGKNNNELVAYLRLFTPIPPENELVFGRVLTKSQVRRDGFGKRLLAELFRYCDEHYKGVPIRCSAQLYLQRFYESFGLETVGDVYLEDQIPHIAMRTSR